MNLWWCWWKKCRLTFLLTLLLMQGKIPDKRVLIRQEVQPPHCALYPGACSLVSKVRSKSTNWNQAGSSFSSDRLLFIVFLFCSFTGWSGGQKTGKSLQQTVRAEMIKSVDVRTNSSWGVCREIVHVPADGTQLSHWLSFLSVYSHPQTELCWVYWELRINSDVMSMF